MSTDEKSLLIVYNADSGLFNTIAASVHKIVSPQTYECALCKHTFGTTGMLAMWKSYLDMQPFPVSYSHRDEFRETHPEWAELKLPAILLEEGNGEMTVLIEAEKIRSATSLSELISMMEERLASNEID